MVLGILLCAKTKQAKTQLAAYFADGTSHVGDDRLEQWHVQSHLNLLLVL